MLMPAPGWQGGGDRLDASSNDGIRWDEDSEGEGQAPGSPANVGDSVKGVAGPVSQRRAGAGRVPSAEGFDDVTSEKKAGNQPALNYVLRVADVTVATPL
jgi:hypothetical protein